MLQTAASEPVPQPIGPPGTWLSIFHDEFGDDNLDLTAWRPNRFGGASVDGPFNPSIEGAAFDPANVSVGDGTLRLTVDDRATTVAGRPYALTSGTVSTQGKFSLRDGDYVEARIKVPRGDGLWPAFWACTDNAWPPEIDGFEFFDTARQSAPRFNYHYPSGGQSGPRAYGAADVDYRDGWHTYGWLRRGGTLTPFVDGLAYRDAGASGVDSRDYFIIVNLSVYANSRPPMEGENSRLQVDWVRAWKPALTPSTPLAVASSGAPSPTTPTVSEQPPGRVQLIGSTSGHSATPTSAVELGKPPTTTTGDLLIATLTANREAQIDAPPGWRRLTGPQKLGTGAVVSSYYRFSAADDPPAWTWRLGPAETWGGGISSFRGVDEANPFDGPPRTATETSYRATALAVPSATTSVPDAMLVTGYASDSSGPMPTPPEGFLLGWISTGGQAAGLASRVQQMPGSTGSPVWRVAVPRALATWMVTLRPGRSG
ncbi:MAG TPA: family 16 glycosylhydrolase [Microlunatus sp.]